MGTRASSGLALRQTLLASVLIQVTLVVTGVVVARALGPEDRGYLGMITVAVLIGWQLGGLGIPYALTYVGGRMPRSLLHVMGLLRPTLLLQTVIATVACGIGLAILTLKTPSYVALGAALAVAATGPIILFRCALGVLQGLRRFTPFNVLRVLPNAIFSVVALLMIASGARDLVLYAGAWAASQVLVVPMALRSAKMAAAEAADPSPGYEAPSRRWILSFGRRALLGGAPPLESYKLDQAAVAIFLSPVVMGYYVVALAFTNLPRFIAQGFGMVATPSVAGRDSHASARRAMWRFFWAAIPAYTAVVAPLWLLAPELVPLFFGSEFAPAVKLMRILLLATLLYCARQVLSDAARGAGYPGAGSVGEMAALISALPLFVVFIPLWHETGVAYALAASSAVALLTVSVRLAFAGPSPPSDWLPSPKALADTRLPEAAQTPVR